MLIVQLVLLVLLACLFVATFFIVGTIAYEGKPKQSSHVPAFMWACGVLTATATLYAAGAFSLIF